MSSRLAAKVDGAPCFAYPSFWFTAAGWSRSVSPPATPAKPKGQDEPGDKATDVCHISHPAGLRRVGNGTDAARRLQNDPLVCVMPDSGACLHPCRQGKEERAALPDLTLQANLTAQLLNNPPHDR